MTNIIILSRSVWRCNISISSPDDPVTEHMDNTATSRGTSTSDVSSAISIDRERDCDSDNDSINSTYIYYRGWADISVLGVAMGLVACQ